MRASKKDMIASEKWIAEFHRKDAAPEDWAGLPGDFKQALERGYFPKMMDMFEVLVLQGAITPEVHQELGRKLGELRDLVRETLPG